MLAGALRPDKRFASGTRLRADKPLASPLAIAAEHARLDRTFDEEWEEIARVANSYLDYELCAPPSWKSPQWGVLAGVIDMAAQVTGKSFDLFPGKRSPYRLHSSRTPPHHQPLRKATVQFSHNSPDCGNEESLTTNLETKCITTELLHSAHSALNSNRGLMRGIPFVVLLPYKLFPDRQVQGLLRN